MELLLQSPSPGLDLERYYLLFQLPLKKGLYEFSKSYPLAKANC